MTTDLEALAEGVRIHRFREAADTGVVPQASV